MFNYKKVAYFLTGLATVGTASVIMIASPVFAQTNSKHISLAQDLANTYHLNEKSVQQTIKEYNKTHHHKRIGLNKRLDMAVKNGKITQAQKTSILTERKLIASELKKDKSISNASQKKAAIKSTRQSAIAWAKSQNIKPVLLSFHNRALRKTVK